MLTWHRSPQVQVEMATNHLLSDKNQRWLITAMDKSIAARRSTWCDELTKLTVLGSLLGLSHRDGVVEFLNEEGHQDYVTSIIEFYDTDNS
jgi:hypothetical protein